MTTKDITKSDWVEKYAGRILKMWEGWQSPLGCIGDEYVQELRDDLGSKFDDPLKRALIETTY